MSHELYARIRLRPEESIANPQMTEAREDIVEEEDVVFFTKPITQSARRYSVKLPKSSVNKVLPPLGVAADKETIHVIFKQHLVVTQS